MISLLPKDDASEVLDKMLVARLVNQYDYSTLYRWMAEMYAQEHGLAFRAAGPEQETRQLQADPRRI